MLTYKKMSLFDAPKGEIIVHACNSQGMWGSGIAKPFAENYPNSYKSYKAFCSSSNESRGTACGLGELSKSTEGEQHYVGYIVTSHNYGHFRDVPEQIKANTGLALYRFCKDVYNYMQLNQLTTIDVYSNKFNSGLFAVPWEESELILNTVLRDFKRINWIVCDPEGT